MTRMYERKKGKKGTEYAAGDFFVGNIDGWFHNIVSDISVHFTRSITRRATSSVETS